MKITSLLIANRGEIAVRIARAASELAIRTTSVFSEDDVHSPHVRAADNHRALLGTGPAAYLDGPQLIAAALDAQCDAVHPGYGFVSENAAFAAACQGAGLRFVGPSAEILSLFGDKGQARAFAIECDVPVIRGTTGGVDVAQIETFMRSLGTGDSIMIKAISGGGGRGMRIVHSVDDVAAMFDRCAAEAVASFGSGQLYAERLVSHARHIEVQILGDGSGAVVHLWERECSLQRRNQKVIEFAPAFGLPAEVLQRVRTYAVALASRAKYSGLGTFEFLVEPATRGKPAEIAFMEANPRLQVEHTVTEEITGIDLVQAQLRVAAGESLADIGLVDPPQIRGRAIQLRVNMETIDVSGDARPGGGRITEFALPSGPGVRVDTFGEVGYAPNPRFDSLLAKLIVHTGVEGQDILLDKARRALQDFRIDGVPTNAALLFGLLTNDAVRHEHVYTRFVEENIATLLEAGQDAVAALFARSESENAVGPSEFATGDAEKQILSPMPGAVVEIAIRVGDRIKTGQVVATVEAMKMQHEVQAMRSGVITSVLVKVGDAVAEGQALMAADFFGAASDEEHVTQTYPLEEIPHALAELLVRRESLMDANRLTAVEARRKRGQRTARENVEDLIDAGTFMEYGALAIAAQRSRRTLEDLIANTPADGIVIGLGSVNGAEFGREASRCMVFAYDYTVLAGTQGRISHEKTDRALLLAEKMAIPVVMFTEGGGGRPGDVDSAKVPKLNVPTFARFARLSGLAPRVGIVSGYSFAGNAALLGCCDLIVATRNASFGMAGPAMIEGGGLGTYKPSEVGPISVQVPNGVVDVLVEDEAEAVAVAKKFLGYFQGSIKREASTCADQRILRHLVPENRLHSYEMRTLVHTLADTDSVLELRPSFGIGIMTALVRIEGRAFGLIANNPKHLGGAIDADAGDKAARFMQLCDAFDIPMISLCDTPGFMVGPEAEKTALVRHVSRMFVTAANLSVPFVAIVVRKGYGLGAQAMTAGGFHEPLLTVAWPSGEFGGMGLEGAVRLGYRKELEQISDSVQRDARFRELLVEEYARGSAQHVASHAIIDDVIDPAATRSVIARAVMSKVTTLPRQGKKRAFVDAW